MNISKKRVEEKIKKLEKKIKAVGPFMRGSIVQLKVNCGNKNCKCYMNKNQKHPAYYFSVNINKKTKMTYIGEKRLKQTKYFNDNYKKLRNLIDEMTKATLELVKLS